MKGILLASGQHYVCDCIKDTINTAGGVYVGLMTDSSVSESDQLPSDIQEISGSGYSRQLSSSWSKLGTADDPYIQGSQVTFIPSGVWSDVNGYFVSTDETGDTCLWAEPFQLSRRGTKQSGYALRIIPIYKQKYRNEP